MCSPRAIGGDTVVVPGPEPRPVPNEVADSFDVIRSVRSAVGETVEDGRFPLVLARQLLHLARDRGRGSAATSASSGSTRTETSHAGLDDHRLPDGMGLAMLLGDGWSELRATIDDLRPVPAENALLVSARDLEPTEVARVAASDLRRADADTLEPALDELATRESTPSTSTSTST